MSGIPTCSVPIAGETDGGDRVPELAPDEALGRWLNRLRGTKRESTVSAYYYQLKHFVEWCEQADIATINEVSGWDLETYETHRREAGVKQITLNKELGTLQNFLEYCARIELVDETLPEKVDPPGAPTDAQVDETRLPPDRSEALLAYYDEHDRGSREHVLLALAWFTGARLGALRGLDVDDYDSGEQYLQFIHRPREDTPLKNGLDGERAVGLPEYVCEVVDTYLDRHRHRVFDDHGRPPLIASQLGRPSTNSIRSWMYLATVPCLHTACPHGNDPETCEYLDYTKASQCPSSRSPHHVRTGSITWQLNRGVPVDAVSKRVNTSERMLKRHYDQPTKLEELEERRRQHVHRLAFDDNGGDDR